MSPLLMILFSSTLAWRGAGAFSPLKSLSAYHAASRKQSPSFQRLYSTPEDEEEVNEEGMDLAAQFAKLAQERNIALNDNDF